MVLSRVLSLGQSYSMISEGETQIYSYKLNTDIGRIMRLRNQQNKTGVLNKALFINFLSSFDSFTNHQKSSLVFHYLIIPISSFEAVKVESQKNLFRKKQEYSIDHQTKLSRAHNRSLTPIDLLTRVAHFN